MNDKNRSERDNELIDFFRGAIRIPSPSGGEKDVAHYLSLKMQKLGFDEVHIDDFGSVVGIINGNYDGKTVLIDGHIDNVDVIDESAWKHSPWGAEIDKERIYGRGTSDMKGGVCSSIMGAGNFLRDYGRNFKGRIAIS